MNINKEIYYHANSGDKYKVGDILIFNNKKHNKMYEDVFSSQYKLNNIDANELLYNKIINKDNNLNQEKLELVFNTINNDAFIMRELALEEVRKNKYPNIHQD